MIALTTPLPDWLSIGTIPRYPTTVLDLQVVDAVFASVFEHVIEQVADGKSPRIAIQQDQRGISFGKFMAWVEKDEERLLRWRAAQRIACESLAPELLSIADGEGLEEVSRASLRINTRRFLMGKWHPERYGDVKATDGNSVINVTVMGAVDDSPPPIVTIDGARYG